MTEPNQNNNKGEETTPEPSLFQITSYVARQLRAAIDAEPYSASKCGLDWQLNAIMEAVRAR
jgi:hypothetical protein